jgi:hypothetical protein
LAEYEGLIAQRLALVDAVDHLLNKGVMISGEATLSLAGVDLVYLGLNVLIASVETLRNSECIEDSESAEDRPPAQGGGAVIGPSLPASETRLYAESRTHGAESLASEPAPALVPFADAPARVETDDDDRPERGLARLVLTLIELLRQVVERQALRRVEGEGLSDEQVERMGVALMELEAKMAELREVFGLSEEDLNLDLGPLGRLL